MAMRENPLDSILVQGAKQQDALIRRWARLLLKGDGRAKAKPRRKKSAAK
jgi:hypothetical protein